MIPLHLLALHTWEEIEEMVCGRAEIDLNLLQSITEYSGCSASDPHIGYFWQVMKDFSNDERSAFIRFTWGRSRLPLTAAAFSQRLKLQSFHKTPADQYFPVSHTCFFSIELPTYSSVEVMREKLLYAIFNCEAIDGDDTSTGIAVANMGWEDQDD
jgi:E3 ubiquitin-protein ligase HERC2